MSEENRDTTDGNEEIRNRMHNAHDAGAIAAAEKEIERLAGLTDVEYELEREETANRLKMRVTALDRARDQKQPKTTGQRSRTAGQKESTNNQNGNDRETTTDENAAMEAAISAAEAAAVQRLRAQYLDTDRSLAYAVPLADQLALIKSDGSCELCKEPDPLLVPSRSTFTPAALKRYLADETVSLTDLLDRLTQFIRDRVVLKFQWQAVLLAIWIFGTYLHVVFRYYGYLHVGSPARRSGKSLLLELIGILSFNASAVSTDPTPAVIFRDSNRNASTQIFDEMEHLHTDKEKWGAVVSILNVGFKRGATVPRVLDPKTDTLREFEVYSPKAIASINHLPDTTADRTFHIELLRKRKSDKTKRMGTRQAEQEASGLRDDCCIAALRYAADLADYEHVDDFPLISDELDARARDILEPLLAIAAAADGESGQKAYYLRMIEAVTALGGFRDSAESNELNLIAAANALRGYDQRPEFALTGKEAFALFKQTDELGWLDSEAGAKALLRRLGFRSGSNRKDLFREVPKDSKDTVRGYRISRAELDDFIDRYAVPEGNPG